MEKENQRVMLTKRLIREALITLMAQKQIRQISVRELCEQAGINRSTFYKHYGAPEGVLQEIQQDLIWHIITLADEDGESIPTRLFLERVCEYLWENRKLNRILLSSQTGSEGSDIFRMTSNAMWSVSTFRPEVGQLEPLRDQAAMLFVEAGCYAVLRWWILEEIDMSPKQVANSICNLIGLKDK